MQTVIKIKDADGVDRNMFATVDEDSNYSLLSTSIRFEYAITKGQVAGVTPLDKYGELPNVDIADAPVTIWEGATKYPYDAEGTAPIQSIVSDDVADTQDVSIEGLDIDGNLVVQTPTLTGTTRVTLATPLYRVFRMQNDAPFGNDINGTVSCYIGTSSSPGVGEARAIIVNGNNQTLMAVYTIPKGLVGFLHRGEIGTSRNKDGDAVCSYVSRRFGKCPKVKKRISVVNNGNSNYQDTRSFPDVIPSLTDIHLNVEEISKDDMGFFATFDIALHDENQFSNEFLVSIGQPGY